MLGTENSKLNKMVCPCLIYSSNTGEMNETRVILVYGPLRWYET